MAFMAGPSVPMLLFLILMLSCTLQSARSSSSFTDQSALVAFKSKISSGPNETVLAGNWSTGTNFCSWIGISCSRRRQRVAALNLSYMGLQGTISPEIGNLSFLVSLDLSNNNFFDIVPHEISRLRRLRRLRLSSNLLEGSIPPTVHSCQKLQEIDLSINRLTGPLPFAIFSISSLTKIRLYTNHLSGTLPMDLCSHCPNLQRLVLSDNELSGRLPSQMNNCRELEYLHLRQNKFDGSIPEGFGSLEKLESLNLGENMLTGNIPATLGNLSRLYEFGIDVNNINGSIPTDLWLLPNIMILELEGNQLTGAIPKQIFNTSSLMGFSVAYNSFSGNLPSDTDFFCPNLLYFIISANKISGRIPSRLSNCSNLVDVGLSGNLFSGPVPKSLGKLQYLEKLFINDNQLREDAGDQNYSFLSSLSNCRSLKELWIGYNPLNITLSDSIGNFSVSLNTVFAAESQIQGNIPMVIGSLKGLALLDLGNNSLHGDIPLTFARLENLQRLYLENNNIEGFIPEVLCQLSDLGELDLSNNKISGSIPNCTGNLSRLQKLNLSSNRLESSIPLGLWGLESILSLDLSMNSLGGYLSPDMKSSDTIEHVDLSRNKLTGDVPRIFGAFESLSYLDLSINLLQGDIPESFGSLKGLDMLNLSHNNLSGVIPKSLKTLTHLKYLNLSFNELSGEIPSGGPFANFTAESFLGNRALCGNPIFRVPPCPSPGRRESRIKQILLKYFLPVIASIIILLALVYMLKRHRKSNSQAPSLLGTFPALEHRMISYQELCQGTNSFCESNLLGVGGFGSVYKGILSDGAVVAVKVLNLQLGGAFKSFDTECEVLRAIRHRNLVKVISSCSNPEFRALVLQYMSNGSLERWLYSYNYCLNLLQRVNIMIDVASAMEYLHHGRSESVVHCDLKPTNILLDDNMVAHVSDFGIAKILIENKDETRTRTLGTLGYIAPEYGSEGRVSMKGDVYSYGVILLEMITRKKPTSDMFAGGLTLRQWINASLPDRMMEVVDHGLLRIEAGREAVSLQNIISSILDLGLKCSEELPDERIDIKEVLAKLNKIKLTLFGTRNRGGGGSVAG